MAELVDATDSKSVVLRACLFESGQGHHSLREHSQTSKTELTVGRVIDHTAETLVPVSLGTSLMDMMTNGKR